MFDLQAAGKQLFYVQPDGNAKLLLDFGNWSANNSGMPFHDVEKREDRLQEVLPFEPWLGEAMQGMGRREEMLFFVLTYRHMCRKPRPCRALFTAGYGDWQRAAARFWQRLQPGSCLYVLTAGGQEADGPGLVYGGEGFAELLGAVCLDVLYLETGAASFWGDESLSRLLAAVRTGGLVLMRCQGKELPSGLALQKGQAERFLLPEGNSLWAIRQGEELRQSVRQHSAAAAGAASLLAWRRQIEDLAAALDKGEAGLPYERLAAEAEAVERETLRLYPELCSIEVKYLAARLREALIDCVLGQGLPGQAAYWARCLSREAEGECGLSYSNL